MELQDQVKEWRKQQRARQNLRACKILGGPITIRGCEKFLDGANHEAHVTDGKSPVVPNARFSVCRTCRYYKKQAPGEFLSRMKRLSHGATKQRGKT